MNTGFTLDELKAMRAVAESNVKSPTARPYWRSIFDKLSLAIAEEVCKEQPLEPPPREPVAADRHAA